MCSPVESFYFDAQDAQIQELKEQVSSMASQTEQMQTTITQQVSQIQQHKDQYNILKLKLGGFPSVVHCQLVFYVLAKKQTNKKCVYQKKYSISGYFIYKHNLSHSVLLLHTYYIIAEMNDLKSYAGTLQNTERF